jgi:hypothetical protein
VGERKKGRKFVAREGRRWIDLLRDSVALNLIHAESIFFKRVFITSLAQQHSFSFNFLTLYTINDYDLHSSNILGFNATYFLYTLRGWTDNKIEKVVTTLKIRMTEHAAPFYNKNFENLIYSQPPKSIQFASLADRKFIQVRSMRIYVFLSK